MLSYFNEQIPIHQSSDHDITNNSGNYNGGQKSWDKFIFVAFFSHVPNEQPGANSSTYFQPFPPPPPPSLYNFGHVHTLFLSNTWFGTFWVKVVFAMHVTACMHYIFMLQLTSRFDFLRAFPGVKPSCFCSLFDGNSCLYTTIYNARCCLIALTIFVPSNTARAILRKSTENSDIPLAWRKIEKENKLR